MINKVVLLIEYFKSKYQIRDEEYKTCIIENINNNIITEVIVFISDDSNLDIVSEKLKIIRVSNRPTFKFFFEFCNSNYLDNICIIANTDIIFDDSLSIINNINMNNIFLALTRWDMISRNSIKFFNVCVSQDSWIFRSPVKIDERTDFLLGKPGCDNRISQIFHEMGYNVKNPGKQIITKHFHISGIRNYTSSDTIHGPYLLLVPNDNIQIDTVKMTINNF